jgi:cellulose synthase/poly-beta-1,6-N-acetylglucosamine synthase-like glycosyltransferase
VPLPYFAAINIGIQYLSFKDLTINIDSIRKNKERLRDKTIIYLLTTRGYNINSVENSVKSVAYWIEKVKKKNDLIFDTEIWVVTEEDTYLDYKKRYDRLSEMGAKIIIVPWDYETPNKTKFKARALEYAKEIRRDIGLNTKDDWVYHQDEETMIGEDTVLGNLEFILNSDDKKYGAGIILYPLGWSGDINSIQEVTRSIDDFRLLSIIKLMGYPLFSYHGSHFIVRSDVEDKVGWDYGVCRAEDYLFTIKLNEAYKNTLAAPLKGFAYEKPPFTIEDHFKQRRRWILGTYDIIKRKDVPLKYRIFATYSLASWYSGVPSILAVVMSIINPTGGLFIGGGVLTGFVWYSIYYQYLAGYQLHKTYVKKPNSLGLKIKLFFNSINGLVIETLCPWYALIKRTTNFECIKKDDKIQNIPYRDNRLRVN